MRRKLRFQSTFPVGGATAGVSDGLSSMVFQSTLPVGGSDNTSLLPFLRGRYFNPRSPHGERQRGYGCYLNQWNFNPRSPHGERQIPNVSKIQSESFQSTLPAWGATIENSGNITDNNFNPRSPHGERLILLVIVLILILFQSTLPAWGATINSLRQAFQLQFQSTLPAWGATVKSKHTAMTA